VILLGENHLIKDNLLFVQELIPILYKNGIYTIGMEFGAAEVQGKLDSLINSAVYDEKTAQEIMHVYNETWGYKEYIDIYRSAWKLNKSLPAGSPKFIILNLSYIFEWDKFPGYRNAESMKKVFPKGTVDKFRAEIIENEVLNRNEKILVLTGTPHAFTKYGFAYFKYNGDDFTALDYDWLGNRLYRKFPGQIFYIMMHQAFTYEAEENIFWLLL
jgi:hypothetical protein